MMCIIFINILSTVSFDIFIGGTVKQIVKFISYLTDVAPLQPCNNQRAM